MKKLTALLLSISILLTGVQFVFAAENTGYADELFDLGLFKGTDEGYALDKSLTREESVTLLVRLLGEEENLAKSDFSPVFSDVSEERWSYPYVMYCYENEITKGTGADTFSPVDEIPAEQFVTLVLRLLGYTDATPETALSECITLQLLNSEKARGLENSSKFLRDDAVYIVYRSLMTEMADGTILADYLSEKGVISEKQAEKFNIYESADNIDELLDLLLG